MAQQPNILAGLPTAGFAEAVDLVKICRQAKRPVFFHGPPGIGKTAIPALVAQTLNIAFEPINLPQMDPVDLRGVPSVNNGTTDWNPPYFMRPEEPKGILFIDELTSATPAVQIPAFQLMLERRIGRIALPDGWTVMGAGNTAMDNSIVFEMPSPLRNRMMQFVLKPTPGEWLLWAKANAIDARIVNFLTARQNFIYDEIDTRQDAFPTPRSWHALSDILVAAGPAASFDFILSAAKGWVGSQAATMFVESCSKPILSVSDIRRDPKGITLPAPSDLATVVRALAKSAEERWVFQDVAFLQRLNADYREMFLIAINNPTLQTKYKEWL